MELIGITGKSGSGKSYFANKLKETIKNSDVINFDDIFSEIMDSESIISRVYVMYGNEAIKKGKINLDKILTNKEMFDKIYQMIVKKVETRVRQDVERSYLERKADCDYRLVGIT